MVEIFHYDEKTRGYKKLQISPFKEGVIIKLIEGTKGAGYDDRNIYLNRQELAYLILELRRLYDHVAGKEREDDMP